MACYFCAAPTIGRSPLCTKCTADLPVATNACQTCAIEIGPDLEQCGPCVKKPPLFDAAFASFQYDYPLDHLVTRFKFGGDLALGRGLTHLMATAIHRPTFDEAVLVPVPLHTNRLRERGFDQARELAKGLAKETGMKMRANCLRRIRDTDHQLGLKAPARRKNLKSAFEIGKGAVPESVILVDDVLTTGTTANACAKVLKEAECQRVVVWALARAELG